MPREKMQRKVVIKENFTEENRVCVRLVAYILDLKNEDKRQEQLCDHFKVNLFRVYVLDKTTNTCYMWRWADTED